MPANTIHRNEEAEDGPAEGACVGLLIVLLSAEDPLLGFLPPPVEAGGGSQVVCPVVDLYFFLDDFRFFRFFRFCVMVLGNTQAER